MPPPRMTVGTWAPAMAVNVGLKDVWKEAGLSQRFSDARVSNKVLCE